MECLHVAYSLFFYSFLFALCAWDIFVLLNESVVAQASFYLPTFFLVSSC
jgi:hypothetical protein